MNKGTAVAIFKNLFDSRYSIAEKGAAIRTVIDMETHNNISKCQMLAAMNWMWEQIFEIRQEEYENIKKGATFPQRQWFDGMAQAQSILENLPSAQQGLCEYCHEDSDGYVKPVEKNCHAFISFGMDGWELSLKANGWHGSAKIKYCPMCGRKLEK